MNRRCSGFTFIELIVSMTIVAAIAGVFFHVAGSAHDLYERELEAGDIQQRGRVSLDALFRDVVMAGVGPGPAPAVAPYRRGLLNPDPDGAVHVDRLSVLAFGPHADPATAVPVTFWVRTGPASDQPQLMRYDGDSSDLPVCDYVSQLRFDYFDAAGAMLPVAAFGDGPWIPDAVSPGRFDATLLDVRRVRASIRIRPARVFLRRPLPQHEFTIDIAPRRLEVP